MNIDFLPLGEKTKIATAALNNTLYIIVYYTLLLASCVSGIPKIFLIIIRIKNWYFERKANLVSMKIKYSRLLANFELGGREISLSLLPLRQVKVTISSIERSPEMNDWLLQPKGCCCCLAVCTRLSICAPSGQEIDASPTPSSLGYYRQRQQMPRKREARSSRPLHISLHFLMNDAM